MTGDGENRMLPRSAEAPVAGDALFSIDVAAEVRKLCGQQLSSSGERTVEWVRAAIRHGARAVRVSVGLRWTTVDTIGGRLSSSTIERLAILADPSAPSARRHAALLVCEAEQELGLLAIVAAPAATVVTSSEEKRVCLTLRDGKPPVITGGSVGVPGMRLRVARSGSRRLERQALRRACRYSSVPVFVGGRQVSRGTQLPDCILETTVRLDHLEATVGIPRTGELCQTSLLCREVVFKESFSLSRRGYVHVAVARDFDAVSGEEIDQRAVKRLVDHARQSLYRRLAEGFEKLSAGDRNIARSLLFRRCERANDPTILDGLLLFRRMRGSAVDLASLRRAARGGSVWAVGSDSAARRWLVPEQEIFVLDRNERDFLTKLLGVGLLHPPALGREGWWRRFRSRLGRVGRRLGEMVAGVAGRVAGVHPLNLAELSPIERDFLALLQAEIGSGRYRLSGIPLRVSRQVAIEMCERGPVPLRLRRGGDRPLLLVPRRHPRMTPMIAAVDHDPVNLYPVMAALFGGHDGYGADKEQLQRVMLA